MWEAFGLDKSVELVYEAMLTQSWNGIADLASQLGCKQVDIRRALDELSQLSLLRPSRDDPDTFRLVSPELAVQSLLARQEAELVRRQAEIVESRAAAAIFAAEHTRARTGEGYYGIEKINGIDTMRDRLECLARGATHEVISLMPDSAWGPADIEASRELNHELLGRGIKVATIYLNSIRNDGPTTDYALWLAGLGGKVRTLPTLPTRLIVFDRSLAVIPSGADASVPSALVVHGAAPGAAFGAFFDQLWAAAYSLEAPSNRDDEGLTGQERALLSLLAQGATDTVVARKLGISPRTARRNTAQLMERLEARSRFQAGAKAAERGWLSSSP